MKKAILAALLVVLSAGAVARLAAEDSREKAAQASATAWLTLVDAGKYGESWDAAAPLFQQATTRSQWEAALQKVRAPLGKAASRSLKGAKFLTEIPGAPAGEYVIIQYDTRFENKAGAVETVTPMRDKNGVWKVSGYYIK